VGAAGQLLFPIKLGRDRVGTLSYFDPLPWRKVVHSFPLDFDAQNTAPEDLVRISTLVFFGDCASGLGENHLEVHGAQHATDPPRSGETGD
jgi:hypothetical protein